MRIAATLAVVALPLALSACVAQGNRDRTPATSVGGAGNIAPQYNERHYAWCARQYNSYRRVDNTYARSATLRRRCVSPFI